MPFYGTLGTSVLSDKLIVKMSNPMIEVIFCIKNRFQTCISFQLHIAHYKEEYGSISEALKHSDGATILAFPFKVFIHFALRYLFIYYLPISVPNTNTRLCIFVLEICNN